MKLTPAFYEALINEVRQIAREEIMPRFRNLETTQIDSKTAPDDLVTIADKRSEERLTEAVGRLLPSAAVVGEEAVSDDPSRLSLIDREDICVIVDPVDGTWNYANGLATFGVIIAVTFKGETVFGLLYDPVLDDWICAEKGAGSRFQTAAGHTRKISSLEGAGLLTGMVPLYLLSPDQRLAVGARLSEFNRLNSLRCSCHEYRLVSQGRIGFCLAANLKPWDHAAGALIVEEAGGAAQLITGERYRPTMSEGMLLTAASPQMMEDALSRLRPALQV
ncbi:inositol monophosphatase [Pseudovibrio sp. SPO723]|uniref:inositol monophosphatase family protein n=1 Tax=Nesiotobacter zosterae TaxID=392721 RepID=UPI0029C2B54A|nr:inositol monophosphatase [Pseudovibrio sp. SPO723]MDX5593496.1 inositol monophosphatase [Pseudovibrio sp. SPO723]